MDKKGIALTLLLAAFVGIILRFGARLLNLPTNSVVEGIITGFICVLFYNYYFEED